MDSISSLVDTRSGTVRDEAFSHALYAEEMEKIFARCWLFLGHESMIPKRNDFFTHYMGQSSVIVMRDSKDKVRVFLNKCRHRGALVCAHERGNAKVFVCPYHGWTYNEGRLTGAPYEPQAYQGDLDPEKWSLVEVPRVAIYEGLIFGCWDETMMSLEDFLGDARWYIDNFLTREYLGGIEILPGPQRYMMPTNWKLLAENFCGDTYHFTTTHAGVVHALHKVQDSRIAVTGDYRNKPIRTHAFTLAANYGTGVPHGFWQLKWGPDAVTTDLDEAAGIGPEAVEWVKERHRLLLEKLKAFREIPYGYGGGNIFPNLGLVGMGSALYGKGLILHHPRAVDRTEVWMWCAVEKNAPTSVKNRARFVLMQRQAAAGMVAPDDHAIFERITEVLDTPESRRAPLNYRMGIDRKGDDHRPAELKGLAPDWPGYVAPIYTEACQRDFYRYWAELMQARV